MNVGAQRVSSHVRIEAPNPTPIRMVPFELGTGLSHRLA